MRDAAISGDSRTTKTPIRHATDISCYFRYEEVASQLSDLNRKARHIAVACRFYDDTRDSKRQNNLAFIKLSEPSDRFVIKHMPIDTLDLEPDTSYDTTFAGYPRDLNNGNSL